MTEEPLKLGFIGGGINSAVGYTHKIASQMDNRWKLVAGCFSTHEDINFATAEKYGVEKNRVYYKYLDFLQNETKLDAISVLTPTIHHAEVIVEALKRGYSIICEKALTGTVHEAHKICGEVEKNNAWLAVTYNYTGYPMIRELRQMILDGILGTIHCIQIEMPQEGFIRYIKDGTKPNPQSWRLKDGDIPTISLDLGVHLHQMVHFFTGEKPLEVIADQSSNGFFKQIIDNVMCIARYSNDIKVQMWYSKSAIGYRNGLKLRIFGNEGSAEWYQMQPEELLFYDKYGKSEIIDRASYVSLADNVRYNRFKSGHPAGFIEAFANQYYDLADSLISFKKGIAYKSPYVFEAKIAEEGLKMMEAIALSAKKHAWQKVDLS